MKYLLFYIILYSCTISLSLGQQKEVFLRLNQAGYRSGDTKEALLFSNSPTHQRIEVISENGKIMQQIKPVRLPTPGWGTYRYFYSVDFSAVCTAGSYYLATSKGGEKSSTFHVSDQAYQKMPGQLLAFMRQQRCGYNPFLDMVCHQKDGRIFYGTLPDSTYVDVTGGWHDAGDQLKYLITGSYATGHMLMAYELFPTAFADEVNALGQPGANGLADVLDEARWGLDWILKLYLASGELVHQVGDDRDHTGWKMPDADRSDYGWGPNSYRVAYIADGKPQGLKKYKSEATGVANVAGRSAAALALGARIWMKRDTAFAMRCLQAARELYDLGRKKEGYQQGNSYGAPYRYGEITWADDMEWAAAELYKTTQKSSFLHEAKNYALQANTDNWLVRDTAAHYQYYPFINLGHYALYHVVDVAFRDTLAGYYKTEIMHIAQRARSNPFGIGTPFIWCSNNLLTSFITEVLLYERMTGDRQFHEVMLRHRDWLFGKNPWGTSMFTGIPASGDYPVDIHTSIWALTHREVPGGLVDGPIYTSIYQKLLGLQLLQPDEYAQFQNSFVTYHDDVGDYSTNEPTMDGTAGSIIMMAYFAVTP